MLDKIQNERYHTDFMIQKDSNMIEFNRTYSGMVCDAMANRFLVLPFIRQWRLMKLVLCVMERQLLIFRSTIL